MSAPSETSVSAFIAKLLTPLTEGAKPVVTAAFQRRIRDDLLLAWEPVRLRMVAARNWTDAANCMRLRAIALGRPEPALEASTETCREDYMASLDALMMLPAPHLRGLRWKQENRKAFGGDGLWEASIAADEARLEKPRKAAGVTPPLGQPS